MGKRRFEKACESFSKGLEEVSVALTLSSKRTRCWSTPNGSISSSAIGFESA